MIAKKFNLKSKKIILIFGPIFIITNIQIHSTLHHAVIFGIAFAFLLKTFRILQVEIKLRVQFIVGFVHFIILPHSSPHYKITNVYKILKLQLSTTKYSKNQNFPYLKKIIYLCMPYSHVEFAFSNSTENDPENPIKLLT